jgi:hypothetical protein
MTNPNDPEGTRKPDFYHEGIPFYIHKIESHACGCKVASAKREPRKEAPAYEIVPSNICIDDADIMLELKEALGYAPEIRKP